MKHFSIVIRSFSEIQAFVEMATVQPFEVLVGSDTHRVNGKSFIGMFSLDFRHPLQVHVNCDDAAFARFRKEATRFLIA
ncbi:MAG: hypothetical protein J6Q53_05175 [Oscillospiraceae bacterium]|nr:hypothetical protein [Oscillospiraceae bacterium]